MWDEFGIARRPTVEWFGGMLLSKGHGGFLQLNLF
jgi:hypothetical protein